MKYYRTYSEHLGMTLTVRANNILIQMVDLGALASHSDKPREILRILESHPEKSAVEWLSSRRSCGRNTIHDIYEGFLDAGIDPGWKFTRKKARIKRCCPHCGKSLEIAPQTP